MLGSTSPNKAVDFMIVVVNRLFSNGYPQEVLVRMWADMQQSGYLSEIPCRLELHRASDDIVSAVHDHITSLTNQN